MIEFGTGGFRGVIGETFTPENLHLIGAGIGAYIADKKLYRKVVIGYDFRHQSKEAAEILAGELIKYGITVLLSDNPTPTPTIMYICRTENLDVGIMVTASHNPANYNGVKVFQKDGQDANVEFTNELEKYINYPKAQVTHELATIVKVNALTRYINYVRYFVGLRRVKGVKILFDAIHGTGLLTIPPLLGDTATVINGTQDPNFGGLMPNPTPRNLLRNHQLLLEGQYDLCIATDSDADRLGILDENGNLIDSNEILAALYYYLVKYKKETGGIVKNLATSNLIDALAKRLHEQCHVVDVGFKNISQSMLEHRALIGGEASGGLTVRNYLLGKDSTMAALLFVKMVIELKKKPSVIIAEMRKYARFYRYAVEDTMEFYKKNEVLQGEKDGRIASLLPGKPQFEIINNNIKFYFKSDQWALIRFSGTEPLVRLVAEMTTPEASKKMIETLKTLLKEHYDEN